MKPKHVIVSLLLLLVVVSVQHVRLCREHKATVELAQQALALADSAYTNACEAMARGNVAIAGALGVEPERSSREIAAGSLRDPAWPDTINETPRDSMIAHTHRRTGWGYMNSWMIPIKVDSIPRRRK